MQHGCTPSVDCTRGHGPPQGRGAHSAGTGSLRGRSRAGRMRALFPWGPAGTSTS
jgi:hypothetical protein